MLDVHVTLALPDGREALCRIADTGRIDWSDRWDLLPELHRAGHLVADHGGPGTYSHTDYRLNGERLYLACRDCGLAFPLEHTDADDRCSYADDGHHPSGGELIGCTEDAPAAPSCSEIDLEPLARPIRHQPAKLREQVAAYRVALDARRTAAADRMRECPLCHQLAQLDEQLVCPTCKRAADLAAQGTQQHLFTPMRPQISGQGDLFS